MQLERFKRNPFMAILRGVAPEQLAPLVEAVVASGWETLEITMNTPGAEELIQETVHLSRGRLMVGAGTVLLPDQLQAALVSRASFIVMPTLVEEIVRSCIYEKIPVFPGALTPQEIWSAWQMGASMVKVFPAKCFGPEYFREIKGPFQSVELMACGGVTPQNLEAYYRCGASAFAIGGSVFKKEWLEAGEYSRIEEALKAYRTAYSAIQTISRP